MSNISNDPRTGLPYAPSCSGLERLSLCPGSWEQELPFLTSETPSEKSEEASTGDKIHLALEHWGTDLQPELSESEESVAIECRIQELESVAACRFGDEYFLAREYRIAKMDGATPILSGKADAIYLDAEAPTKALILDYKTGGGAVKQGKNNIQLRGLAVLARVEWPTLQQVTVGIIQPAIFDKAVLYSASDQEIDQYAEEVFVVAESATIPNAQLCPSTEACKYCKAFKTCPATRETVETIVSLVPAESNELAKGEAKKVALALDGATLASFYEKVSIARKLCDAIEEEMFSRLTASPDAIPGYEMEEVKPRVSECESIWKRRWLEVNDLITDSGRAKKGANTQADAAWKEFAKTYITEKTYTRQAWTNIEEITEALKQSLTAQQYLTVAGRIKKQNT